MANIIDFTNETEQSRYAELVRGALSLRTNTAANIITFGCQQNEADSEKIAGLCSVMGYDSNPSAVMGADYIEKSGLIIINTCAIREHAELKALSNTGRLKKLKEEDPELIIGMCGCMVQEKHRFEEVKKSYPFVDFMIGTDSIYRLPEVIWRVISEKRRIYGVSDLPHSELGVIEENMPVIRKLPFKAWVPIMYGCNNFCTYCVVPSVRGHERSRSEEAIIDEVKKLIYGGCKEITLLGQNVNSYRGEKGGFVSLLHELLALDGDFRLRFMTSHPKDASDELIELMNHPKMAKHFHLPFQAGSDRILKLMNRRYTKEKYLERALKIRSLVPDCAITTDVICGFPGETAEEFEETLDVVRQVEFDTLYSFVYSPRKGTPAAEFDGQISHDEKVERMEMLTELINEISEKRNAMLIGNVERVLCDSEPDNDGFSSGRNSQNKLVKFKNEKNAVKVGDFADVKITQAFRASLFGEIYNVCD